jgi:hypothetical protein
MDASLTAVWEEWPQCLVPPSTRRRPSPPTSPAERAAPDFARRPGGAEYEAVVAAGMAPGAVTEVAALTAAASFMNRVATLLALSTEPIEALVEQRFFRLIRPLVAWRMRKPPPFAASAPRADGGPCARVVAALGASPFAHALRPGAVPGRRPVWCGSRGAGAPLEAVEHRAAGRRRRTGRAARRIARLVPFHHAVPAHGRGRRPGGRRETARQRPARRQYGAADAGEENEPAGVTRDVPDRVCS